MSYKGLRVWSLLLVCVVIVSLIGCAPNNSESGKVVEEDQVEEKKPEVVHVTMWTEFTSKALDKLQSYVDQWNEQHPNIQVQVESVEQSKIQSVVENTSFWDNLVGSGTDQEGEEKMADILHVSSSWFDLMDDKALAEVPLKISADLHRQYPKGLINAVTNDDKLLGYPTVVRIFGLLYNEVMLQEAEIESVPKSWLELAETANKIEGSGDQLTGKIGFGLHLQSPIILTDSLYALMETTGASFYDKGEAKPDSAEGLLMLEWLQSLYADKEMPELDVLSEITSENAAMTILSDEFARNLRLSMGSSYANMNVAPIPAPDGKKPKTMVQTYFWGVNQLSNSQEEAWEFLMWLNSEKVDNGITPMGNVLFIQNEYSLRADDLDEEPLSSNLSQDRLQQLYFSILNDTVAIQTLFDDEKPEQVIADNIVKLLHKEIDVLQAIEMIKKQLEEIE